MSRRLSVIPIVHAEADLGKLASRVREHFGASAWRRKQRAVSALWADIRDWCAGLDVSGREVLLYQDGLPEAAEAGAIVRELAAGGSVNHRILVDLIERGARLIGTEDPRLLLREYELVSGQSRWSGPRSEASALEHELESLLARRDEHIARRIGETLTEGGHGVLFIGALHRVERSLAEGIEVEYPLGAPGGALERKERRDAS